MLRKRRKLDVLVYAPIMYRTVGRRTVALGYLACLSIVSCGQPAQKAPEAETTAAAAPPIASKAHAYEPPTRETMLSFAQKQLGPAAPASFGTTVIVTPREPSAGPAELLVFGASVFDPAFNPRGLVGNDSGTGSTRFGLWIRPASNQPTLVDCDIAGTQSLVVTTQVFSADGQFVGEVGGQTLTTTVSGSHWSVAVPWNPQFAPYGVFRLMLIPVNATATTLWGCQISMPN